MAELRRLPAAVTDIWDWQYSGACRTANPQLFFHAEGERGPARDKRDRLAVAVCARCPVIEACRRHALCVREPYGVWGGLTEAEREAIHEADLVGTAL